MYAIRSYYGYDEECEAAPDVLLLQEIRSFPEQSYNFV